VAWRHLPSAACGSDGTAPSAGAALAALLSRRASLLPPGGDEGGKENASRA